MHFPNWKERGRRRGREKGRGEAERKRGREDRGREGEGGISFFSVRGGEEEKKRGRRGGREHTIIAVEFLGGQGEGTRPYVPHAHGPIVGARTDEVPLMGVRRYRLEICSFSVKRERRRKRGRRSVSKRDGESRRRGRGSHTRF